jgi:hypothetical protein
MANKIQYNHVIVGDRGSPDLSDTAVIFLIDTLDVGVHTERDIYVTEL